ncbi:MAG: DnaJ domain-containing protein [Gemmatimonadales bacterium]|jgi:DnaJ-class molecular chaperone
MPFKDYYVILGVPRQVSQTGIRARYRDLVKDLHPDVAGEDSTQAFQDIAEAYGVLSDPEHRRQHNQALRIRERRAAPRRATEGVGAPERRREPLSLRDFRTVRPSFEALFERILRNFSAARVPKSEHLEPLDFEVILTPEEAALGGAIPIGIPVLRTCMGCGGTGRLWMSACPQCAGKGMATHERVVEIRIPPIGGPTAVFEAMLHGLGIENLYLRLHVRVSGTSGA